MKNKLLEVPRRNEAEIIQLTVEDWWNTFEPQTVEMMEGDPRDVFVEDARALTDWMMARGLIPVNPEAPPLKRLFPLWVLNDFYPLMP